jgi:hypothetical protein
MHVTQAEYKTAKNKKSRPDQAGSLSGVIFQYTKGNLRQPCWTSLNSERKHSFALYGRLHRTLLFEYLA